VIASPHSRSCCRGSPGCSAGRQHNHVHSAGGVEGLASFSISWAPSCSVVSSIELWELTSFSSGASVGMAEGDLGDIRGAVAPAREVAAPARRTDLPADLPHLLT
jgi:hypothetical protein